MGHKKLQKSRSGFWTLVAKQHGVISRAQLLALGYSAAEITQRIASGRLHRLHRGVYAVGRPEVSRLGELTAAVLACGAQAVLSHESAAAVWEIRPDRGAVIEVSVPADAVRRRPGIALHRRTELFATEHRGIPVTTPAATIVDLAARLPEDRVERIVNEADKRGHIDPERLRAEAEAMGPRRGAPALRRLLDRHTFTMTDSELEQLFLPIAAAAGLPALQTQVRVNGFKVDFYSEELGMVIETDGLRYHRTPIQQGRDLYREQIHRANDIEPLRFTRWQVKYDRPHVQRTLAAVGARLRERGPR